MPIREADRVVTPSEQAIAAFQEAYLRIHNPIAANRLWHRHLSAQDRERLGGNLELAYRDKTAGMWAKLRNVSYPRAVVEVARKLKLLDEDDAEWLLSELGECSSPDEEMEAAIKSGHLVLSEHPRQAYWAAEKIEIDWHQFDASWSFLWELARHAKAGQSIDRFTFGEKMHHNIVANRKNKLTTMPDFPVTLGDLIEARGRGTQQLKLPADRIQIYELSESAGLKQWKP